VDGPVIRGFAPDRSDAPRSSPPAPPWWTYDSFRPALAHPEEPMSDLKAMFEKAVADSKNLSERPDNATLLKLYALYKQASSGDVDGKRPGFSDMVGRAKWDAWNELKGTASDAAMKQYIELIDDLKG
jgi:acyl-CoA-binding protein